MSEPSNNPLKRRAEVELMGATYHPSPAIGMGGSARVRAPRLSEESRRPMDRPAASVSPPTARGQRISTTRAGAESMGAARHHSPAIGIGGPSTCGALTRDDVAINTTDDTRYACMHAQPASPATACAAQSHEACSEACCTRGTALFRMRPTAPRGTHCPLTGGCALDLSSGVASGGVSSLGSPATEVEMTIRAAAGASAASTASGADSQAREGHACDVDTFEGVVGRTRSHTSRVRARSPDPEGMSMPAARPILARGQTDAGRPIPCDAGAGRPIPHSADAPHIAAPAARQPAAAATAVKAGLGPRHGSPGFWKALKRRLRQNCESHSAQPHCEPTVALPAEQPARFARSWLRSAEAEAEYNTFEWPLTTVDEVKRLLRCNRISPTWLLLGEFTQAQAKELETRRGVVVLTVDRRAPLEPGLAYQGEFCDVAPLAFWDAVMAWPSCTHQALADEYCRDAKALDGRMFWGIVGFIYCYAGVCAHAVVVEQPNVWIVAFYLVAFMRVQPAYYGDRVTKTINLFTRGVDLPPFVTLEGGDWSRVPIGAFKDSDDADRWRSSWQHYPNMTAALASGMSLHGTCPPLVYEAEVQRFAEAWHDAGLPVPADYLNHDGRPTSAADRDYLLVRGNGDGRRVVGVDPRSRNGREAADMVTVEVGSGRRPDEHALGPHHLVDLRVLTASAVILLLVSTLAHPLVFAALDGYRVIGAELPVQLARSAAPVALVKSWAKAIGGTVAASTSYFVGRYDGGPRVAVAPLDFVPPDSQVVRSVGERRRLLRSGTLFAWCTLAALAGTTMVDPTARAFAMVESFVRPVASLADSPDLAHGSALPTFSFGAMSAASMVRAPRIQIGVSPPRWQALQSELGSSKLIVDALLEYRGEHAEYIQGWAELVRPPDLNDVPSELLEELPTFQDEQLSYYPLETPYEPPVTKWLPRRPPQPARPGRCPRSARDLLLEHCERRLDQWMNATFIHLQCTELGREDCQPLRPQPLAIGQVCLWPWARDVIWDFTFERSSCGVPLDVTQPIESNLNLDYLARELRDYSDQRLVSYLLEGVRFEADVELHTVLVPHLLSLARGFGSVRKELTRMEGLGWYKFFDSLPFWPIYINGQGATPQKYEPDWWRRTTEGGGPQKETLDEEGLLALSLNEGARQYHRPAYYARDPQLLLWALYVETLRPHTGPDGKVRKWPREVKPTPAMVMRDIAILRAAGHLLGEPIFLLGDDAKDYFSQLAMAPEAWWQLGVAFLSPSELEERQYTNGFRPHAGQLFFVSERRLGFGVMPSSNIAQRFSEALLALFRNRMDAEELQIASSDTRPSYAEWRRRRELVCARQPSSCGPRDADQQRLYFIHMFTDDPIIGVVGVARALAALRSWRHVTLNVGLIMAIPEKRNLGTWVLWLGILFFAGLGVVVVPRAKLLRAAAALREAIVGTMEFGDYRALIGLLEHLRCVNCEGRYVMHGLYEPHSADGVSRFGPNARVVPSPFMLRQLERWLRLVHKSGGAAVFAALDKRSVRWLRGAHFVASADAATDCDVPGLGGYCHGMYWYIPIHPEWLNWLHITVLELLATGINAIVHEPYLEGAGAITLLSDALATPYALTRQSERSPMLVMAHHALLADPQFAAVAEVADCGHLSGDCNPFSDAVSRAEWRRFFALCRAAGVRPREVAVPERVHLLLRRVVDLARESGHRVRRTPYSRRDPVIPAALLGRDVSPAHSDHDGPPRLPRRSSVSPSVARLRGGGDAAEDEWSGAFLLRLQGRSGVAPQQESSPLAPQGAATLPAADVELAEFAQRLRGAPPTAAPATMPTVQIGDLRLPAIPVASGHLDALGSDSKLRQASLVHAARRAQSMASSPFAAALNIDTLTRLLQHADDLAAYGAAYGTKKKDDLAWRHWDTFAESLGFDPLLTAQQVRDYPEHVSTLLATFLLYIYPKMKGKNGREWAKPRSAFSYVLAIIRIFRRWKVELPPARHVKSELNGLLRAFVVVHGKAALQPRRQEPMKFEMLSRLCSIPDNTMLRRGFRWHRDRHECRAFARMLSVGWRTGHRLAEFVYHPSGEIYYLTRADITWYIAGVAVTDPSPEQLTRLRPGDYVTIAPPRSKTDQFGEIHSPFPSVVLYDPSRTCNAGAALRDIELEQPCRGTDRETTPLFADPVGHPYRHERMDDLLDAALHFCYGSGVAATHSWHSLRSGLASALKEAQCPNDEIQLICRWLNPESLRAYARLGTSKFITWVDAAERAVVDSVQTANIPKCNLCEGFAGLHLEFGRTLGDRAQAILEAEDEAEADPSPAAAPPPPPPPDLRPLTASNCVGRRVLVPAALWPSFQCSENEGAGWSAMVTRWDARSSPPGAVVAFTDAVDARGLSYEDVTLQLGALRPL